LRFEYWASTNRLSVRLLRVLAVDQAAQIEDGGGEATAVLLRVDLDVGTNDAVLGGDREGQLPFVALGRGDALVGDVRVAGLEGLDRVAGVAGGEEEPQLVLHHEAAQGRLVDLVVLVDVLRLVRTQRRPRRVRPVEAVGAGEQVAAGLGQGRDDAAGKPAVLGRDAADRGGGLLDGVLDEQRQRLLADVLVDHHAVDQPQVLVGLGAGDGDVAARSRAAHAGGQQDGRLGSAADRQLVDDLLGDGGRDLAVGGDGLVAAGDDDLLGDRSERHLGVELLALGGRDLDGGLHLLEAGELEGHVVLAWG